MENAILYVRVSSKEQELEGFSVPAQKKLLKEYCVQKGYRILKEFVDIETAKRSGRKQFNEMIKFAKSNKLVKHILVEKTDRLARNITDYAHIDSLMEREDLTIHLVKESSIISRDSRSHQKLVFGMKVVIAKNFSDNLSEETKKGMLEKAEQKIYPSFAPYGYMNVEENGKKILKPDPSSAPYIKRMFELYATGSYSLLSLKKKMLADGMVYRNGKNFYKHTVEVILKNEFYTGIFYWKGRKYENAQHKPLISKELFREVQTILTKPNKYKSRKGLFAFTNLISCGVCGFSITAQIQKGKYIYYHCSGYKGNCGQPYVREEIIEQQIGDVLENFHITDEIQDMVLEELHESMEERFESHIAFAQQIEKQITILQNRIDNAYQDKLDGKISEEFWDRQTKKWMYEKEELSMKLSIHQKTDTSHIKKANHILELAKNAATTFKNANFDHKRRFAQKLFSNCFLRGRNLDLELRMPYNLILESSKTGNWRP